MRIWFETTVPVVIVGVAFGAISGEAVFPSVQSRNYTPSEFRSVLYNLGYNVLLGDIPLTDERTRQAIREFQRQQDIQVDGIAGLQTQNVAADIVKDLQFKLNIVMNPKPLLPESQFLSPRISAIVRQFQEKFDLPVTGIATLEVRNKLEQASKGGPGSKDLTYTPREFIAILYSLGYNVAPDGQTLTDERTRQAIRAFQRDYNLIVDGIAGSQTQNTAAFIVRILQDSLNQVVKLNPPLPRNSFYGSQTEAAVRQFQQLFDLPVTGIASLEVRSKLDQAAKRIAK